MYGLYRKWPIDFHRFIENYPQFRKGKENTGMLPENILICINLNKKTSQYQITWSWIKTVLRADIFNVIDISPKFVLWEIGIWRVILICLQLSGHEPYHISHGLTVDYSAKGHWSDCYWQWRVHSIRIVYFIVSTPILYNFTCYITHQWGHQRYRLANCIIPFQFFHIYLKNIKYI